MSFPDRIIAIGLTLFWPVYFGAEPCVASKTAASGADVRAGRDAEPADEAGSEVGDDVAVEVRQHEHVELLRPLHESHAERVDEVLARLDVGVFGCDLAEDVEEQPVRVLHDVRLRDAVDGPPAVIARVLEGVADDPLGGLGADRLDRDACLRRDLARLEAVQEADHRVRLPRSRPRTRRRRRGPRCSRG